MTQGLILFAHGARDPRWAAPFEDMAARLRARRPALALRLAYLEFMAPDLLLRDPYGEGWLYRLVPADLAYNLRFLECAAPAPSGPAVNKET